MTGAIASSAVGQNSTDVHLILLVLDVGRAQARNRACWAVSDQARVCQYYAGIILVRPFWQ